MVLLDTHVFLWYTHEMLKIGTNAKRLIDEATLAREIFVSAITFWEIAVLCRNRKIEVPDSVALLRSRALAQGLIEIPIDGNISIRSVNLTEFHSDPADRLIVATALEGYTLVTADRKILRWQGPLNRINASS